MKLKYTNFQKVLEFISVIVLLAMWVYLIQSWGNLPDKIPAHYDGAGVVDRWGNKSEVLVMPIMSSVLYILITILSFFPSIWNVPVTITPENREGVYINLKNMVILLKMEIIIAFAYITYSEIKAVPLGTLFSPIFLIIITITLVYYIMKVRKA
ncbi:DUF1648 domain-containing protein [Clostridium sp. JN-9]|uniref:DUF1648 domain-containing protein n=1 Tax=Clostridium sp. JN-9 TaxID=2507159 RepID=UPI000FFE2CB3|nr:DUF1648 domain-containing protein [Clostridium sp. JN-9]QAT39824.1 DUF1648 domain-containing protein [Clostridium sp. JN-9]